MGNDGKDDLCGGVGEDDLAEMSGVGEIKKARKLGQKSRKKGLTVHICYGRIFPH